MVIMMCGNGIFFERLLDLPSNQNIFNAENIRYFQKHTLYLKNDHFHYNTTNFLGQSPFYVKAKHF